MSTPTEQAFTWLRQIPGNLFSMDEKPLLGTSPSFPLSEFAAQLGRSLQLDGLSLQKSEWQWRAEEDLFAGLGSALKSLSLTISPIPGTIWWIMPEQEIARLMNFLVLKQKSTSTEEIDGDFLNAFYRFIAAEALNVFEKIDFDKKLSALIGKEESLPAQPALSLDITVTIPDDVFHGRLLLSNDFRKGWCQRYMQQQSSILSSPLADSIDVVVNLEAGQVNLSLSEWKQIAAGDFLMLDRCSLDPDEDKGRVMLVINNTPFFRGRIKDGTLKILEHPLYYEVDTPMNKSPKDQEKNADDHDFDDEDFDDQDEHEEEDFDIGDEELSDVGLEKTPKEKAPEKPSQPAAAPKPAGAPTGAPSPTPTQAKSTAASIEEVPLNIVIEVGRFQMSIKKLLELQPGNMLELDIHPEAGIDLVVNGKRIARGELLRIGDVLGVRIVELS